MISPLTFNIHYKVGKQNLSLKSEQIKENQTAKNHIANLAQAVNLQLLEPGRSQEPKDPLFEEVSW